MKDTNELIKTWVMKHDKNIVQRNIFPIIQVLPSFLPGLFLLKTLQFSFLI